MDSPSPPRTISGDLVRGPIQLQDAYLYDVSVTREAVSSDVDGEKLTLDPRVRGWSLGDGGHSLLVVLGAVIVHRFRPEAVVHIDLTVAGQFDSQDPIDEDAAKAFAPVNGLLLLWPYLRGFVGQLSAAMQLELPAVPVLSVQSVVEQMHGAAATVEPVDDSSTQHETT